MRDGSNYSTLRGFYTYNSTLCTKNKISVLHTKGKIIDAPAMVDVRKVRQRLANLFESRTFRRKQVAIICAKRFLHGYSVLSETALVGYKCDDFYNKESECGIHPIR